MCPQACGMLMARAWIARLSRSVMTPQQCACPTSPTMSQTRICATSFADSAAFSASTSRRTARQACRAASRSSTSTTVRMRRQPSTSWTDTGTTTSSSASPGPPPAATGSELCVRDRDGPRSLPSSAPARPGRSALPAIFRPASSALSTLRRESTVAGCACLQHLRCCRSLKGVVTRDGPTASCSDWTAPLCTGFGIRLQYQYAQPTSVDRPG
mmetsp:Transcript_10036/g.27246  ORF Transcript_10036/g.27246 Transcript_10036/m.27246 type:complete len:213 (+) Transcript_10036:765-1403(+)